MFRQLTKGEVKQIADIMLGEVFKRAEEKEIKIDVTERFKVTLPEWKVFPCMHHCLLYYSAFPQPVLFALSKGACASRESCFSVLRSKNNLNLQDLPVGSTCG